MQTTTSASRTRASNPRTRAKPSPQSAHPRIKSAHPRVYESRYYESPTQPQSNHYPTMNRIYISGPMEGQPDYNYPKFLRWARTLREDGYTVICPAEMSQVYGTPEQLRANRPLFDKLIADELDAVRDLADSILMLTGWENSVGARRELAAFLSADPGIVRRVYFEDGTPPPILDGASIPPRSTDPLAAVKL